MLFYSHFPLQKCHFHKFAISFLQAINYPGLVVFCIFFGISYGMVGALQFEVLMAIVGTEKFPSAIGLVLLVEAIAVLIGPPGAGQNRRTHKFSHESVASRLTVFTAYFLPFSSVLPNFGVSVE